MIAYVNVKCVKDTKRPRIRRRRGMRVVYGLLAAILAVGVTGGLGLQALSRHHVAQDRLRAADYATWWMHKIQPTVGDTSARTAEAVGRKPMDPTSKGRFMLHR